MNSLDPLVTVHAGTGAFRTITSGLLAEAYLAPRPQQVDLNAVLAQQQFPWSASMEVAPAETSATVLAALRSVASATQNLDPDEIDIRRLDDSSRLHSHLAALCEIWRQAPGVLAEDLQVFAHVLNCAASDALEPLPLVVGQPCQFAAPIERRLHGQLLNHHGEASEALRREWAARCEPLSSGAAEGTSLWRVQQGLTGAHISPGTRDETLSLFGLRDEAEEAEFAAALAQKWIDEGVDPADIAILVPDEVGYYAQLRRAFDDAGVPVSGLPDQPLRRDLAGETLLHLLLCFQTPAPAMALASLYISPLMPWPVETGLEMSRDVMRGRFDPYAARHLTGRAQRFYTLVRSSVSQTPDGILQALDQAAQLLNDAAELGEDIALFRQKLDALRPVLRQSSTLDWTSLCRAVTPTPSKPVSAEAFVEGVSVFTEDAMPWRPSRHLIAMGMSGERWPRPVSASPLFLEGELRLLRATTGLQVETRSQTTARRLEIIRRQFLSASGSLTLLRPLFASNGDAQPPSAALSLIARTITSKSSKGEGVEALMRDGRASWSFPAVDQHKKNQHPLLALPADGVLRLDRNLLDCRLDDDGQALPQSPSRLETLLVSPLAWSMAEFGAEPVSWAPEGLNVIVSGIIAHDVLEFLFPKDAPLPEHDQIDKEVERLLMLAIRKHAPFLENTSWEIERNGLQRDICKAAHVWRDTIEGLGARVLENEIHLSGQVMGTRLHGRVDCLLKLDDGSLLVVDHKKSGSAKRRARLDAGWDLQLALYREMLQQPNQSDKALAAALAARPKIGVAYHLINDQRVLLQGLQPPDGVVNVLNGEISAQAMARLYDRLAEVRSGQIRLNYEDDRKFFTNTAKMVPYALDASPLVARFMMPGAAAPDSMEETDG